MQLVTTTKVGKGGKQIKGVDRCGGVFAPIPGKPMRPAYSYGNPKAVGGRDLMFQCPASAIPDEVFDLLILWWRCRTMRTLPMAGGFLDQPGIVQRAFPIFEQEYQGQETKGGGAEEAAALAVGAMVKAMGGSGGRKGGR